MEPQKRTVFERAKKAVKKQGNFIAAVGIMGALFVGLSAPVFLQKDDTCTRDGKPAACSFDMKWAKSRLSCILKDGKTVVARPLCTHGGSDCVPGYHGSGSSVGKVKVEIRPLISKGRWAVLLDENGMRSDIELPSCK